MQGEQKSVFALFWGWSEDREFVEKMRFGASQSTSNKFIAYFQTHYDYVPQKMPLTLAV